MIFPADFLWGVSTSGFQFEMGNLKGLNVDSNSDWYLWVHDKTNIEKGIVSGDFPENGVNSWDFYERDHEIALNIGFNAYRIGIEWSRIFPKSTATVDITSQKSSGLISDIEVNNSLFKRLDEIANKSAIIHYRRVIEDLRKKGFKVSVCLNHFTLPLWVHNPIAVRDYEAQQGVRGWIDQETIIEFTKYAAYIAWTLGDLVDDWATFNEPMVVSELGYANTLSGFPPGLNQNSLFYKVVMNLIVAHARAYDAIKTADKIKADEDSSAPANVGIIHNVIPAIPLNPKSNIDVKEAQLFDQIHNHLMIQAVCEGYLADFDYAETRGSFQGHLQSKLDWLGINYYTRSVFKGSKNIASNLVRKNPPFPEAINQYGFLCQPNSYSADGNPTSDFGWEIYPEGLLIALKAMQKYKCPLYVMENGVADQGDNIRLKFIIDHLEKLDYALNQEKIAVRGYFHWSLTDNYEWAKGFKMKFGLCEIEPKTKKRKQKKSAKIYSQLIDKYRHNSTN